jgi:hypothetical protein
MVLYQVDGKRDLRCITCWKARFSPDQEWPLSGV